ncbi:DUF3074 domain-containing protein [Mycena kentingensis (nom. inval.)]|nr:DUF3074 domain-containing protein [Mycena kentingensis (nom. inval.)]
MTLNITPLAPANIPGDDEILAEAETLLDSVTTWKEGKTYHGNVKTYSRPKGKDDGAPWHARVSVHKPEEATLLEMWEKLGKDKALNEAKFIPDIAKVTKVQDISDSRKIWTLYYTFSPPIISPRVFTVVQITRLSELPRSGVIVSIPVDLSGDQELAKLEEKGVRGRYVSVERLLELPDGTTEWRMATSSTPGGSIPTFFVEVMTVSKRSPPLTITWKSLDSKIAEDVPHFLQWLHSLPKTE